MGIRITPSDLVTIHNNDAELWVDGERVLEMEVNISISNGGSFELKSIEGKYISTLYLQSGANYTKVTYNSDRTIATVTSTSNVNASSIFIRTTAMVFAKVSKTSNVSLNISNGNKVVIDGKDYDLQYQTTTNSNDISIVLRKTNTFTFNGGHDGEYWSSEAVGAVFKNSLGEELELKYLYIDDYTLKFEFPESAKYNNTLVINAINTIRNDIEQPLCVFKIPDVEGVEFYTNSGRVIEDFPLFKNTLVWIQPADGYSLVDDRGYYDNGGGNWILQPSLFSTRIGSTRVGFSASETEAVYLNASTFTGGVVNQNMTWEACQPQKFTPEDRFLTIFKINNDVKSVKYYLNSILQVEDFGIRFGDIVAIQTLKGYDFKTPPPSKVWNSGDLSYIIEGVECLFKEKYTNYAEIIWDDSLKNKYEVDSEWGNLVVIKEKPSDVAGLNKVYHINKDKLSAISKTRFIKWGGDVNNLNQGFDYGQFILNILQLPFKASFETNEVEENILLGDFEIPTKAKSLLADKIRVNLGEIETIGKYGNFLDFEDVICVLRLPYSESVNIDPEYCINQTLRVEYIINCYDGIATVNIWSSKVENTILTKTVSLGFNIPIANVWQDPSSIGSNSVEYGGLNNISRPVIDVLRYEPLLLDSKFTIPVKDSSTLAGVSGYIEVDNIELLSTAMSMEKEEIKNILKSGVILND